MIGRAAILLCACLTLACGNAGLERAAADYRRSNSDTSLEIVARALRVGMKQAEVERLLGPPVYSPADGIFYYASTRGNFGLVVFYRRDEVVTDRLQSFELGPILE